MTFLFLVVVTLLPYVSLMSVGLDRRKQCEYYKFMDSKGDYEDVDTEFSRYYAILLSSIICIVWFSFSVDPGGAIDSITPSYKTNNWIWTTVAAYLIGLPMAAPVFMLFQLLYIHPEKAWQTVLVAIILVCGILALLIPICQAYTFWLIYLFPFTFIAIPLLLWPQTSEEKIRSDKEVALVRAARAEAATERDRRRSELWNDYKSGKRLVNTNTGSSRSEAFPKRYRLTIDGHTVEVTQSSKYSEIDYEGDDGYRYAKRGSNWTRVGR